MSGGWIGVVALLLSAGCLAAGATLARGGLREWLGFLALFALLAACALTIAAVAG